MDARLQSIRKRIREFDLVALLNLLEWLGYRHEDIIFHSKLSRLSARSLIEDIEFLPPPGQTVLVSVNFGLLSYQTPLPTYFLKMVEQENIDVPRFLAFLQFFADRMIRDFLHAIRPESDARLGLGWQRSGRHLLRLLGVQSPSTLHWLFQLVFPELEVAVVRDSHWHWLAPGHIRLGANTLGEGAVFGGRTRVRVRGFTVELLCEEDASYSAVPWGIEAVRRLEGQIFPLLAENDVHMKVILVIRDRKGWARLGRDSLLGYDVFKGGRPRIRRAVIFRGKVRHTTRRDRNKNEVPGPRAAATSRSTPDRKRHAATPV